jgi:hypothetical protein
MDPAIGMMYILAGHGREGRSNGDGGAAKDGEIWEPMGLGLSNDMQTLYFADCRNHKIRAIRLTSSPLEDGTISTIAGNGNMGFSGDGLAASVAQLNNPTCVQMDLNEYLWICDSGNNRIRVVSLGLEVRIPGTNEFAMNIILTAAGTGLNGLTGERGDGGPTLQAQFGGPKALAVSQAFINAEVGTLPSTVYTTEDQTHTVRGIGLDFEDYLGIVSAVVGTDIRCTSLPCNALMEATPNKAVDAQLDDPSGIATQDGLLYVSDTRNHRILLVPRIEYVSMGCWRENTEQPWIPVIEPDPEVPDPFDPGFLNGLPEVRADAVRKCALATLKLGYKVFAIRRMGACATGPDAYIQYMNEGQSTSCANGLGGARDNSVYRFAREGGMVEMDGLAYILAGRQSNPDYTGDEGTAWMAELNTPTGLTVNPSTKDLWIVDSGNQVIRQIFYQVGPNKGDQVRCTNGQACQLSLSGNGMQPNSKVGVMPLSMNCGEPGIFFSEGFEFNPATEVSSPSFTLKSYELGIPFVQFAGSYRLCYCADGAVIFGKTTACGNPEEFIQEAGILDLSGPDASVQVFARAGVAFEIPLYGLLLSQHDRIRVVAESQQCGLPGAEKNCCRRNEQLYEA